VSSPANRKRKRAVKARYACGKICASPVSRQPARFIFKGKSMRRTITTLALLVVSISALHPNPVLAQRRGPQGHSVVFIGGYFYDPFFGQYPWWTPGAYPYPYFPVYDNRAQVRLLVTPKTAAVYVDGYYAGIVDDFDGVLQSLPLSPGAHQITVFLEGYQTVHQNLYLAPTKSYKVRYTMRQVAAGEQSEPPPSIPPVPPPPAGSADLPRTPRPGTLPLELPSAPAAGVVAPGFGTLALRVQPADADVLIDREKWTASQSGERLLVQVAEGLHHIEIQKSGYRSFASDVTIQRGETRTLNVSLSSQ
jgi:hypothetical protein